MPAVLAEQRETKMPRTEKGVEGSLRLRYLFKESSSGHTDSTQEAKLVPSKDGQSVVLEVYADSNNVYGSPSDPTIKRYEIGAAELEKLITEHGRRVSQK